jgi:hypothetical protein
VTELADTAEFVGTRTRPGPWRSTRLWLAFYSILLCAGTFEAFGSHTTTPIMSSRADDVAASIAVLDRGGPPLLGSDVPYHPGIAVAHLRPIGVTDDQGIFVYLPFLSRATGEKDPSTLLKWLFMGCFALLVLVYPLMFYELFGSVAVAVAAPVLALWKFGSTETLDLYWVLAWCMLLGIPGLVLAYKWWSASRRRAAVLLLTALMLVASFSTSIRIHSGLPILLGGLGVAGLSAASPWRARRSLLRFWRLPTWWARPAVAVVLVVAYLSIGTFGLAGVRAYRNHVIHEPTFGSTWPTQHPFWHNAYIGLGYLPNKYGIEWNDSVSADAVQRDRPGTGFLTKEYEATLRHRYFQIAKNDPTFVLRNFWTKSRVLVADAVSRFWPAFILLPVAAVAGIGRRSMRVALLVATPAALFGALGPLLTIPYIAYELAWLGTWGALFLLALGWLWVNVTALATADLPSELAPLRKRPDPAALEALRERLARAPAAWVAVIAFGVTLVLVVAARPAPEPSSGSLYASQESTFVNSSWLDRPAVRDWRFAGALPSGWTTRAPTFLERDNGETNEIGLYIRSPMTAQEDILAGPTIELPAGHYDLVTSGRALVGGFQLSVRAQDGSALATSGYSSGFSTVQTDFLVNAMSQSFTLAAPTPVRVIVSSWSAFPNSSALVLWKMKILRAGKH